MSSKQVIDREKSAAAVVAVGETQSAAAGAALAKLFKPHLQKGESLPDLPLLMLLLARAIDAAKTAMANADSAHEAELGDDDAFRRARDTAAVALSDKI